MKTYDWVQWTSPCRLAVATDSATSAATAREAVAGVLAGIERAMNRWAAHSEISLINAAVRETGAITCRVSSTLAAILAEALEAYRFTDGAFDPRVEDSLQSLGYGPGLETLTLTVDANGRLDYTTPAPQSLTDQVRLTSLDDGWELTTTVTLDLTALGKAFAADQAATAAAEASGAGVLVSLGGDIATAAPAGHQNPAWGVTVQDLPDDPQAQIDLIHGGAIATSSTQKRHWGQHRAWHHIIDPRTGLSAAPELKTTSVIAGKATTANALATAAIVWGKNAGAELAHRGYPARLVAADNTLIHRNWPAKTEQPRRLDGRPLTGAHRD